MKICVLIPCFNESQTIGTIVEQLQKQSLDVVVVDDGSSDQTALNASTHGAHVISIARRGGKGNALQKGFDYVLACGYDALVVMDGDGQHAVEDVPKFIERYKNTKASIINGNRMDNNQNMPWLRRLTNALMSWMISCVCHQRIKDSQCGFRLISAGVLRVIKLTASNFEIESEILIKACRKGFKVDSVEVQTIYQDEQSKIHPIKDTFRFLRYLARELMSRE